MEKLYSSSGDQGETDQLGPGRISKNNLRIHALGALDEATAALGFARSLTEDPDVNRLVMEIQQDLYRIMSLTALVEAKPEKFPPLEDSRVKWLEDRTDYYAGLAPEVEGFILPGGTPAAGAFSLARTAVRRAEREAVALEENGQLVSRSVLPYLNRLSSLCYALELVCLASPPTPADQEL